MGSYRDGRNRLIFNLDAVLKSLRAEAPTEPEGRKPIRPKRRVSDTSDPTNPIDVPAPDLIIEGEVHPDRSRALQAAKEVVS